MAKNHFVLVHNAFHGAWIWYKLKPLLESSGNLVTAFDLAASGADPRPIQSVHSFDDYSQPLIDFFERLPVEEKVILVGFSLGGMTTALAAEKFPEKIKVLVFINAFMPDQEHVPSYVLDKYMETPQDWEDCVVSSYETGNGTTVTSLKMGKKFMRTYLYQECSVEDYELAKLLHREGSFFKDDLGKHEKFGSGNYESIPKVYVMGGQDKATPKPFMQWMVDNFSVDKVYEIEDGDHMLMLSKPRELCDCLLEVAANYA